MDQAEQHEQIFTWLLVGNATCIHEENPRTKFYTIPFQELSQCQLKKHSRESWTAEEKKSLFADNSSLRGRNWGVKHHLL